MLLRGKWEHKHPLISVDRPRVAARSSDRSQPNLQRRYRVSVAIVVDEGATCVPSDLLVRVV
jgi:hypothetical protein